MPPLAPQRSPATMAPPNGGEGEATAAAQAEEDRRMFRPLSRAWRWGVLAYALLMLVGLAAAMLMSSAPGSGRVTELVALLQQPYLQLLDGYRGQDDIAPDIDYVVYESEDETEQGLKAYLTGRTDMHYMGKGILPGVSVVRIRKDGLQASLTDLRQQPFTNLVLKARVGMVCH